MNSVTILIRENESHLKGILIINFSVNIATTSLLWGRNKYIPIDMNKTQRDTMGKEKLIDLGRDRWVDSARRKQIDSDRKIQALLRGRVTCNFTPEIIRQIYLH